MQRTLLLKIGGVLVDRQIDWRSPNYVKNPPKLGVKHYLERAAKLFEGRIHVVGNCRQRESKQKWLESTKLIGSAGLPPHHLHFYQGSENLAWICHNLQITDAVVSKPGGIMEIELIRRVYLLDPARTVLEKLSNNDNRLQLALSWSHLMDRLAKSFAKTAAA